MIGDLLAEPGRGDALGVLFKLSGIGGRLLLGMDARSLTVSASFDGFGDKLSCLGAGF